MKREIKYYELERDIFVDHLTDLEIAEKYGLSNDSAVRRVSRKLGLYRPKHGEEYKTNHTISKELEDILKSEIINSGKSLVPATADDIRIRIPKRITVVEQVSGRLINSTKWYVPEFGTYLGPFNYLVSSIESRLGIDFDSWENRWYLELSPEEIYTETWASRKVEFYYSDKSSHTKEFIKRKLLENHYYICNFLMLKKDFIEQFNNTRKEKYGFGIVPDYDFSTVPDIIQSTSTRITIICRNHRFDNPLKEIGEFETTYNKFILEEKDSFQFSLLIRSISRKQTLKEFIEKANEVHGGRFDYSRVIYVDCCTPVEIIDKQSGETFFQKPVNHLAGRANYYNRSKGEMIISDWLLGNKLKFSSQYYIKDLYGRSGNGVKIDFVVEYQGTTFYIEYNGAQHYEDVGFFSEFSTQVRRDEEVRKYVKSLPNHKYLEIPYTIKKREEIFSILNSVILNGTDPDTLIDYKSLYKT